VTDAVAAEARTPSSVGEWQREAHALVALAKRSPERAALAMSSFRQHQVWQVRLYAARAAAVLKDAGALERLTCVRRRFQRFVCCAGPQATRPSLPRSAVVIINSSGRRRWR
jgi:hypothetical protein